MYDLHVARSTPRDLDLTLLRKQQTEASYTDERISFRNRTPVYVSRVRSVDYTLWRITFLGSVVRAWHLSLSLFSVPLSWMITRYQGAYKRGPSRRITSRCARSPGLSPLLSNVPTNRWRIIRDLLCRPPTVPRVSQRFREPRRPFAVISQRRVPAPLEIARSEREAANTGRCLSLSNSLSLGKSTGARAATITIIDERLANVWNLLLSRKYNPRDDEFFFLFSCAPATQIRAVPLMPVMQLVTFISDPARHRPDLS